MCFERLITEVHTIKVYVVTTTGHCVLRKMTIHQSVEIRAVIISLFIIMNLNAINQT